MILSIVWLAAGLAAILIGANLLTDGSSAIARRFGLSDLVVGLTVVALGTSAPEFVISVISAVRGSAAIAVGNVVGSNIFNILVIIGITAMVRPIRIERSVMCNEIPMVVLSSVIMLVLGTQSFLDPGYADTISRCQGIFLLIFFLLFMRYTLAQAKTHAAGSGESESSPGAPMGFAKAVVWVVLGLAGLVWGGDRFVDGATGIARALGVSDAVIGLTVVAAGTSLPELAASIVAACKNMPGLAIGNVIGSNIFNVLFVLGSASVIRPLPFGGIGVADLSVLLYAGIIFLIFGWFFRKREITRAEGAIMFLSYVAYTVYLIESL